MLNAGDRFERYTIEAPIGHGGMGVVYRAQDARLGRRVALKVLSEKVAGPHASARLLREARAAAALDHPNAVAIFDVGETESGAPYIVMELVEGKTLRASIGDASLSLEARLAHLADTARALGSAHKRGLVHRDVKPENIMIRDDGMVKVLDFGIARRTHGEVDPSGPTQTPALSTLTIDGLKLGTPLYMAPEQIRGDDLDGRADQFSWGVVAYELLTGKLPWRGNDALSAMASALTDPVDRGPLEAASVPVPVQEVLLRALSKRPEDRFSSMEEVVRALDAAGRGESPGAPIAADRGEGPSATLAQKFSTSDVREVLEKAVERQAEKQSSTKLGFEDLLAIAADVGVDPESLREASRALRARNVGTPSPSGGHARGAAAPAALVAPGKEGLERRPGGADSPEYIQKRDAWLRLQRRNFRIHAAVFVIVNVALLILGLVLLSFTPWWIWPITPLLWAIGLAIHGYVALTSDADDFRVQNERMEWWLEERRRRHEERLAIFERRSGVVVPRRAPEKRRIEASREADRERLRLSDTAGDSSALAEEEAESLDHKAPPRKRGGRASGS